MRTQKTILSAAFVIAFTYGLAAVLSLVRSRLLAGFFGTAEELAVFYTADKIPSFVYSLIVVGTISTVFIPVFANILKHNKKFAWETASSMINISVLVFAALGVLVVVFAPFLIRLLSVWRFTDSQVLLGARLMRIMIIAQLILILSSFITSLLQSFKYFVLPALAPVVYNLGMIGGILFLTPKFGIFGPAYGVIIGAILHLLIQLPLIRRIKFNYSFTLNIKDKGIREIFALVPPRIFGSALVQISSIVNNSIAILVSTSSVVIFKFADQLQSFPVNLFGASIALAALPTLSFEADSSDKAKFKKTFLTSFHQMLFLVIPASVILLVLRVPLVRLVFGASNFPWEATVKTAYVLAFFSLSIFAQSSVYLLTRAFFALKDTLTPVKVNFFTILFSIALSLTLIHFFGWGIWAVAFSYSLAAILDASVLLILLCKRVGGFKLDELLVPFTKVSYAALFMGVSLYIPLKLLDQLVFDTTRTVPLIILTAIVTTAGILSYLFFTWLLKVEEIELFYKILRRLNFPKKPIVEGIHEAIQE
jgi:putative peptidoglycan lipid II flippase